MASEFVSKREIKKFIKCSSEVVVKTKYSNVNVFFFFNAFKKGFFGPPDRVWCWRPGWETKSAWCLLYLILKGERGGGNISQNCTLAMFWYSFQWNLNWAHLRLAHPSSLKSLHGKVRRLFLEERFSNTVLGSFMLWKLKITMQRQWQGPHLTKLGKANPCSPFRRSFSRLTRPSLCTRWARTCVKEPVKNYLAIFFR